MASPSSAIAIADYSFSFTSRPLLPSSFKWRSSLTGRGLLACVSPIEGNKSDARVLDKKPASEKDIIQWERLVNMNMIPSRETVDDALDRLRKHGKSAWGVHITNFGYISVKSVRFLAQVFRCLDYIASLKNMVEWLQSNEVMALDSSFARSYANLLLNTPGVMVRGHSLGTNHTLMTHVVFTLRNEEYVDDEVPRRMMEVFSENYGENNRYLFIPPTTMQVWTEGALSDDDPAWNWSKEGIKSARKAFAFVHMRNHWGVLEVDFIRCKISFGDSLGYPQPMDVINALRRWLRVNSINLRTWAQEVGQFPVPKQPSISGSCGIIAANSIECCFNPDLEKWTHARSTYHRLRYLKLIVGYSKLNDDLASTDRNIAMAKAFVYHPPPKDPPASSNKVNRRSTEEKDSTQTYLLEARIPLSDDDNLDESCCTCSIDSPDDEDESTHPKHPKNNEDDQDFCGDRSDDDHGRNRNQGASNHNEREHDQGVYHTSDDNDDEDLTMAADKGDDWAPNVEDMFGSADAAENQIRSWANRLGFEIRIGRSRYDVEPRVIFVCTRSGKNNPKKVSDPLKHRNTTSKRIQCPCRIVIRSPKKISPSWRITTLITHHNHEMDPNAGRPNRRNVTLSKDNLEFIKSMIHEGTTISQSVRLLRRNMKDAEKEHSCQKALNAISLTKAQLQGQRQARELLDMLQERLDLEPGWFVGIDRDSEGHLRRLFWMESSQRLLYCRYRDVVLHGKISQINRFGMPLSVFVVVDTDGRTRIIACALLCGETTEDYEWNLRQLLIANDKKAPAVIVVDEDVSMETACATCIPDTQLINCIWHLGHCNLNRNLHGAIGFQWEEFITAFWKTRNATTRAEFERQWKEDVVPFVHKKSKAQAYLARLFDRREHWAWAWVGSKFTAGIQSTQRVERTHSILKKCLGEELPLRELFQRIEDRVSEEALTIRYLQYKENLNVDRNGISFFRIVFSSVQTVNDRFLGTAARSQMTVEMMRSIYYQSSRADADNEDAENVDDIDDAADEEESDRFSTEMKRFVLDGGAEQTCEIEKSSRADRQKRPLRSLMEGIDSDQIHRIYNITHLLDSKGKMTQNVIVLKDGSYLCTCLLLQNNGIVCRHFFHLMQKDSRCRYHIRLVPMRWFKEIHQDDPELDVDSIPFCSAVGRRSSTLPRYPEETFMKDIMKPFQTPPAFSRLDRQELSRKRTFGETSGMLEEPWQLIDEDDTSDKDNQEAKTKEKPKSKRTVSTTEDTSPLKRSKL